MAIVNDQANQCVVNTETGEYMDFALYDRETNSWYFNIQDKNDKPLFGAIVRISGSYDSLEKTSGEVLYSILKVWFPSGKKEAPTYYWGQTDWIDKLGLFLEKYKDYYGVKDVNPRFSFKDERTISGGMQ